MLTFKRLDSNEQTFFDFFEKLGLNFNIDYNIEFKDEEHFNSVLKHVISNLTEIIGIFTSVSR